MKRQQIEILLKLAVLIARARPQAQTSNIPVVLGKLQRLSETLTKRYLALKARDQWDYRHEYEATTVWHEKKAVLLGQEIGIVVQTDAIGEYPLIVHVDNVREGLR